MNEANAKGFTPLMLCPGAFVFLQRSGVLCLQVLLSAGALVNIRNSSGKNALEYYLTESRPLRRPRKNVMILLYAAGEKVNPVTVGTPDWFRMQNGEKEFDIDTYLELTHSKLCLRHMCREKIRTRLIEMNPYLHLLERIPRLGLPSMLTSYLLFHVNLNEHADRYDSDSAAS